MAQKRPGRPALDEDDESTGVYVKLPSQQYDEMYQRATKERVSVPELIRRQLTPQPPNKNI